MTLAEDSQKTILVTGGAGYIGSHVTAELLCQGHSVIVVDNLSNSFEDTVDCIEQIAKRRPLFYNCDICDRHGLDAIFGAHTVDAVVHLAALKSVEESTQRPLDYMHVNVSGTVTLLGIMDAHNSRKLVYSSSAAVYGSTRQNPIPETHQRRPCSPYGESKAVAEQILKRTANTSAGWEITILRYFNPGGAHPSGHLGEHCRGSPSNLLPIVAEVAAGLREHVSVFGTDHGTEDGTCIRDYVHVVDIAHAHVLALQHRQQPRVETYNLGSGSGCSVAELLAVFAQATATAIQTVAAPRRPGDAAVLVAEITKARSELGWQPAQTLERLCSDHWSFVQKHLSAHKRTFS